MKENTPALAVFNPVWAMMYGLGFITGISGSVLFSNNRGRGNQKASDEYFTVSVICSAVLAAAMFLVWFGLV